MQARGPYFLKGGDMYINIIELLESIKEACEKQTSCDECPFLKDHYCSIYCVMYQILRVIILWRWKNDFTRVIRKRKRTAGKDRFS